MERVTCSQCDARTAPKIPRERGSVTQTVAPLRYLVIRRYHRRCQQSATHVLLFKAYKSDVCLKQYRRWTRSCGRPRCMKEDARLTNLGETLQGAFEADGTQLLDVPGEAHGQAGTAEVRGRETENLLLRVMAQLPPQTENANQTMVAHNFLVQRHVCSPRFSSESARCDQLTSHTAR